MTTSKWEDLTYPVEMQFVGWGKGYSDGVKVLFDGPRSGTVVYKGADATTSKKLGEYYGHWNGSLPCWKITELQYDPDQQGDTDDDI
jgi:hypothetical protein